MFAGMGPVFKSKSFIFAATCSAVAGTLIGFLWNDYIVSSSTLKPTDVRIILGASVTFFVGIGAAVLSVWNAIQTARVQRNQKLNEFKAEAYVNVWKACAGGYRVLSDSTSDIPTDKTVEEIKVEFKLAEASTLLLSVGVSQAFYEYWGEVEESFELCRGVGPAYDKILEAKVKAMGEALDSLKAMIQSEIRSL